jgi:hypothetical protein
MSAFVIFEIDLRLYLTEHERKSEYLFAREKEKISNRACFNETFGVVDRADFFF